MIFNNIFEDCVLGDEGEYNNWVVRRNICVGVANGIRYLHTETLAKKIHRPINLRTIFLDDMLLPKIGGFWMDCTIPDNDSDKEDVYNYGVLLLEIVSRRIVRRVDRIQKWVSWFPSTRVYSRVSLRVVITKTS